MAEGSVVVTLKLEDFNDTVLLGVLLGRNEITQAPVKTQREGVWYQVIIGIGDDEVAYLTLTDDALEVLKTIIGKKKGRTRS